MSKISAARYEHLSKCISSSVAAAIEEIIEKNQESNANLLEHLQQQINFLLTCTIKSEQEEYIENITKQLETAVNENKDLQYQVERLNRKLTTTKSLLQEQNITFINKTRELENSLYETNWKRTVQEGKYREAIKNKENLIKQMSNSLKSLRQKMMELKSNMIDLNTYYSKQFAKQRMFVDKVKDIVSNSFQNSISYITQQNVENEEKTTQNYNDMLKTERTKNQELRTSITRILNTIIEISNSQGKVSFNADNFIQKEREFHQFIIDTVQNQRNDAIKSIKKELKLAIPNITFSNNSNIAEAVSNHCNSQLNNKDKEKEIEELKIKIKELKGKLRSTMHKISDIQSPKKEEEVTYESVITDSDDWERRRRELESKITKLSSRTSSHFHKSIN